jgi:hypothetical protein
VAPATCLVATVVVVDALAREPQAATVNATARAAPTKMRIRFIDRPSVVRWFLAYTIIDAGQARFLPERYKGSTRPSPWTAPLAPSADVTSVSAAAATATSSPGADRTRARLSARPPTKSPPQGAPHSLDVQEDDMEYRTLGSSDLTVSEVALGSWLTYSGGVSREATAACTKAAFDAGINFFDTANVYGRGAAETAWGEILSGYPRGSYVLATKLFWPMAEGHAGGLTAAEVHTQIDASLSRLRTDYGPERGRARRQGALDRLQRVDP